MPAKTWITLGAIVATFAVANVLSAGLMPTSQWRDIHALMLAMLFGFGSAQVTLIGMRASLYRGNVFMRLPWTAFLALSMLYSITLGERAIREFVGSPVLTLQAIVLGVLVSQSVIWILAQTLRWRLLAPSRLEDSEESRKQFSIQHLAIAVTAAALMLALGKVIFPDIHRRDLRIETFATWAILGLALQNILVTAPWIWIAFASRVRLLILLPAGLCVTGFVTLGLAAAAQWLNSRGFFIPALKLLAMANVTQCSTVVAVCVLLRCMGFRLDRYSRPA